jgi:hypothetical protein
MPVDTTSKDPFDIVKTPYIWSAVVIQGESYSSSGHSGTFCKLGWIPEYAE